MPCYRKYKLFSCRLQPSVQLLAHSGGFATQVYSRSCFQSFLWNFKGGEGTSDWKLTAPAHKFWTVPSAGTVWVGHSDTLQCPWPNIVWATLHMLTCALTQGKLTSQEYTPFLKWLLLSVSSFRLLHQSRPQDGLMVAMHISAHPQS